MRPASSPLQRWPSASRDQIQHQRAVVQLPQRPLVVFQTCTADCQTLVLGVVGSVLLLALRESIAVVFATGLVLVLIAAQ